MRNFIALFLTFAMGLLSVLPAGATMTQAIPDSYLGVGGAPPTGRSVAEVQQGLEDISSLLMETLGGHAEHAAVTLSSDAFAPVVDYATYPLLPESGTTDNLSTISATGVRDGGIILLRNSNTANTITIKDSTGNLHLADGVDYAINRTGDYIAFVYRSSAWYELFRVERNAIVVLPGAKAESQITEASNLIIPTKAFHKVEGEGAAADQLDGAASTFGGSLLTLRCANASHAITITNNTSVGAGYYNFLTQDGNSVVLNSLTKYIQFHKDTASSAWREYNRSGFSSSSSWTIQSKSGAFAMSDASLSLYKVDTSGGAGTGTLATSPADGRIYKAYCTSASNNLTIQTTGGELIYFPDGTTATSFTLTSSQGVCELIAVTGGYLLT
jgi:hypothetical protein